MPNCLRCSEDITYLKLYVSEPTGEFNSSLGQDGKLRCLPADSELPEKHEEWCCPECGALIATDEEEAVTFLKGIELARAETDADYKAEGHIEVEISLAAREELTGDTWGVKSIGGRTISIRVEAATNDRVVIEDLIEAYAFLKRLMAKRGLLPTNEPEDRVVLQGAKFWRGE